MNKNDLAEILRTVADNLEAENLVKENKELKKQNEFLKNIIKLTIKVIVADEVRNELMLPVRNFKYKNKFDIIKSMSDLLENTDKENFIETSTCVKDLYKEITKLDWDEE